VQELVHGIERELPAPAEYKVELPEKDFASSSINMGWSNFAESTRDQTPAGLPG
jgi:hypothetical protein